MVCLSDVFDRTDNGAEEDSCFVFFTSCVTISSFAVLAHSSDEDSEGSSLGAILGFVMEEAKWELNWARAHGVQIASTGDNRKRRNGKIAAFSF